MIPARGKARDRLVVGRDDAGGGGQIGAGFERIFDRKPQPAEIGAVNLSQAEIDVVASTNQAARRSDCLRLGRGLWRAHAGTIDPDCETVEPALRVDDRNERLRRRRRCASSCKRKKGGDIEDHRRPPSKRSMPASEKVWLRPSLNVMTTRRRVVESRS